MLTARSIRFLLLLAMLPEVKALLVSPFINGVWFELDPDYTTQHIITPVLKENLAAIEQLSEDGKAEINSMRIVQEPIHLDNLEIPKMYIRLIIHDQTVATMLTPPYSDIPYISVMASMRTSLLKNITIKYQQAYTPGY
ncbi:hypothetical protein EDD11_000358 [Mortierella claussenii]|nr:hypothetical protein EDD11_000358 [Mortierella claussenii]